MKFDKEKKRDTKEERSMRKWQLSHVGCVTTEL